MRPFRSFRNRNRSGATTGREEEADASPEIVRSTLRRHGGGGGKVAANGAPKLLFNRFIGRRQSHPSVENKDSRSSLRDQVQEYWKGTNAVSNSDAIRTLTRRSRQQENNLHVPAMLTSSIKSDGSIENVITRGETESSGDGKTQQKKGGFSRHSASTDKMDISSGREGRQQDYPDDYHTDEYDGYEMRPPLHRPTRMVEREYFYDTRDQVAGHAISCENWSSTSSISSVSRNFAREKSSRANPPTGVTTRKGIHENRSPQPNRSVHSESTAIAANNGVAIQSKSFLQSSPNNKGKNGLKSKSTSHRAKVRVRRLAFDPVSGSMETIPVRTDMIPEDRSVDYSVQSNAVSAGSRRSNDSSTRNQQRHASVQPSEDGHDKSQKHLGIEAVESSSMSIPRMLEKVASNNGPASGLSLHSKTSLTSKAGSETSSDGSSSGKSSSSSSSKSVDRKADAKNERIDPVQDKDDNNKEKVSEPEQPMIDAGISFPDVDLSSVSSFLEMMPSLSSLGSSGRSSLCSWARKLKRVDDPPGQIGIPLVPLHPIDEQTNSPSDHLARGTILYPSIGSTLSTRSNGSTGLVIRKQTHGDKTGDVGESVSNTKLNSNDANIENRDSDSSIGLNSLSAESSVKTSQSRASMWSKSSRRSQGSTKGFWTFSTNNIAVQVSTEAEANRMIPLVPMNQPIREQDPSQPVYVVKSSLDVDGNNRPQERIKNQIKQMVFPDVRKVNSDPESFQNRPTLLQQQQQEQLRNRASKMNVVPQQSSTSLPTTDQEDGRSAGSASKLTGSRFASKTNEKEVVEAEEEEGIEVSSESIAVTGQIGNPWIESLNDTHSLAACSDACSQGEKQGSTSSQFSISDGNSIIDTLNSCSGDESRDDRVEERQDKGRTEIPPSFPPHTPPVPEEEAVETGSFNNDNLSLNNNVPWRVKDEELLKNDKSNPPPLFLKALSNEHTEETATNVNNTSMGTPMIDDDRSTGATKSRRSVEMDPKRDHRSVSFADHVYDRNDENDDDDDEYRDEEDYSVPSTVVSQVTMDPSLLDNYSFVQFERNFCMDLGAAPMGAITGDRSHDNQPTRGGTSKYQYDQDVTQRYQYMKERKRSEHGNQTKMIKFVDKSKTGKKQRRTRRERHDGVPVRTADALERPTWSMEGLVESVSSLWS